MKGHCGGVSEGEDYGRRKYLMLRAMCMNGEVLVMVCWPCDLENVLVDTRCVHGLDHFRNVPLTLLRRRIIAIAVVLGWRCVVFGCGADGDGGDGVVKVRTCSCGRSTIRTTQSIVLMAKQLVKRQFS